MTGSRQRSGQDEQPDGSGCGASEHGALGGDLERASEEAAHADGVMDVLQDGVAGAAELVIPDMERNKNNVGPEAADGSGDEEAERVEGVEEAFGLGRGKAAGGDGAPGLVEAVLGDGARAALVVQAEEEDIARGPEQHARSAGRG